ncbi:unnamed protein product, partial [Larinioides sclopetarius]
MTSRTQVMYYGQSFGDNATCHVAWTTMDWYDDNGVNRLDQPAQIPDLNPKEKFWDGLDRRIKGSSNLPKLVKEFTCPLQSERKKIPLRIVIHTEYFLSIIQILVESMLRSVKAVIALGGGST